MGADQPTEAEHMAWLEGLVRDGKARWTWRTSRSDKYIVLQQRVSCRHGSAIPYNSIAIPEDDLDRVVRLLETKRKARVREAAQEGSDE